MKSIRGGIAPWLTTLLFSAITLAIAFFLLGQVVPPGSMGVTQIMWGPGKGFSSRAGGPGLYLSVPFYRKVHVVPETLQVIDFNRHSANGHGALVIQATGGSVVDLDISVFVRFQREAKTENGVTYGGPGDLFRNIGMTPALWDQRIRLVIAEALKNALGNLQAAEFYDVKRREEALAIGETEIRKSLAERGVHLEMVLLRRYTYQDDRIDEAIFNKNLQQQEQRLKAAGTGLAEIKATLEQVSAEWDAKIETMKVQGENNAAIVRSEAARKEVEKRSEGDLLVAKAQAEVDQKRAAALAQSQGAQAYVARELVPFISTLRGGVVREVDPYNLSAWLEKLGVRNQGGTP